MGYAERRGLIEELEEERDSRVLSYVLADRDSLKQAGRNFLAPPVPHGVGKDATNRDEWAAEASDGSEAADDATEAEPDG